MNPVLSELIKTVKTHTQACLDILPKSLPSSSDNPFVKIQTELKQQFPGLTEIELITKSMEILKNQFLQSLNSDDTSMKSTSSKEMDDDNSFHVLAGESQDPDDDAGSDSIGNFWDSLTEIITEKIDQRKDKGKKKV